MSDTVLLAIIAVMSPIITGTFLFFTQRANKREDWKRQDAVAAAVQSVKEDAIIANAERSEQLTGIKQTGDATHAIVNSQKTVMLQSLAMMARARASDHPDDPTLAEVARQTEKDLEDNVRENADPATKVKGINA